MAQDFGGDHLDERRQPDPETESETDSRQQYEDAREQSGARPADTPEGLTEE